MTQPTYDVIEYAFVDDDGTEAGSTVGTSDTDINQEAGSANRHRIRLQIQNTNNKVGTEAFDWEYRRNTGSWTAITTSSTYVQAIASGFGTPPADGDDCTNRLTGQGGSFDGTNNGWSNTGNGTSDSFAANGYWEVELCYYLIEEGDSSGGDTLEFRVVENSGDTTTFVVAFPTATLSIPITITVNTITLAGSAETITVVPGAVSPLMDELTLAGSAETMMVVQMVVANTITLASSAETITVVPGAVSVVVNDVTLAGSAETVTVLPGPVSVVVNELTLASSPETMTVVPVTSIVVNAITLAGSAGLPVVP
jgi:hypothetical protein